MATATIEWVACESPAEGVTSLQGESDFAEQSSCLSPSVCVLNLGERIDFRDAQDELARVYQAREFAEAPRVVLNVVVIRAGRPLAQP